MPVIELATLLTVAGFIVMVFATMRADRVVGLALAGLLVVVTASPEASIVQPAAMVALTGLAAMRRPEVLNLRALGPIGPPLALLLGVLTFATWTHAPLRGWGFLALMTMGLLSSILLMRAANADERRLSGRFLVALGVLASVYAVLEVADLVPVPYTPGTTSTNQIFTGLARAQATFGHPLPLAFFLLAALLIAAREMSSTGAARVVVVGTLFVGLLATGSRSALLLTVMFGVFVIGRRVNVPLALWIGALGATLAVTFGVASGEVTQRFLASDSLSHRLGAFESVPRLLQWQDTAAIWLGNGVFSAPSLFARGLLQKGEFFAVDNQYVTTLVEGGVVGVVALLWLLVAGFRSVDTMGRLLILATAAMFLSFDLLFYPTAVVIMGFALGRRAPQPPPDQPASVALESSAVATRFARR